MKRFPLTFATMVAAACLVSTPAPAQTYPAKPIRIIVPFPAGGTVDQVTRILQPKLAELFGQPILIENKSGAGDSVGAGEVAKSPPDGHTLLVVFDTHAVNHHLYKLPYDTFKSLDHLMLIVTSPMLVIGAPNFAPANIAEVVAHAKATPGRVTYGSVGTGSSNHLNALILSSRAGIEMTHVPYKGGAPMLRNYYEQKFGVEILVPSEEDQIKVDQIIFNELVRGSLRAESKEFYLSVCDRLRDNGAQGVILGCTELFLLITGRDRPNLPMFDTTALHVEAAVTQALDR